MCRTCDDEIWQDVISGDWYLQIQTDNKDGDDWIFDKIFINFCPQCGKDYRNT